MLRTTLQQLISYVEHFTRVGHPSRAPENLCALSLRIIANDDLAVVLGDFVFIDGGEISQLVDGIPDLGQRADPGETSWGAQGYVPGSRQSRQLRIDARNHVLFVSKANLVLSPQTTSLSRLI